MSWEELLEQYLHELRARRLHPHTIAGWARVLENFRQFCEPLPPSKVDRKHVTGYWKSLEALKATTRYLHIGTVRRWLKWAAHRGHLAHDPAFGWEANCPSYTLRWVPTETQMLAVLEVPSPTTLEGRLDRVLFEFLYGTGLRAAECQAANLGHLDGGCFHVACGKGGKSRDIPLGDRLLAMLGEYLQEVRPLFQPAPRELALFLNTKGSRLRCHSLSKIVRDYAARLEMPDLSVHAIRHAYATHMLLGGAPVLVLKHLLGHDSLDSTAIYTRMLPTDLQAEVRRTHPRGRQRRRKPPQV